MLFILNYATTNNSRYPIVQKIQYNRFYQLFPSLSIRKLLISNEFESHI